MLKGKTAVVTGASRGIGRAIALKFSENGANIAVIYNGEQKAAEEVIAAAEKSGVKALCYRCDVSDSLQSKQTCEKIAADFGSVDILVNNAGMKKDGSILKMSDDDFDSVIAVNLKGAFQFVKHLSRYILKSSCGRIINISSISGLMGNAGQANYSAAKAGMIGLTKTIAKEFAGRAVTCNAIAPGFIETDMTADLPQAVKDNINVVVPLKRMGRTEEVSALALFLASEQSGYITGEVIRIDGGMCM